MTNDGSDKLNIKTDIWFADLFYISGYVKNRILHLLNIIHENTLYI